MEYFKAEEIRDERGAIFNGTPDNPVIRNVMYITGQKGAVRGNHVHNKDSHYCMCVVGSILYEYQEADNSDQVYSIIMHPGSIVLSEPGENHRFTFLEDGAFVAMATEPRTQDLYESDTIRVNF